MPDQDQAFKENQGRHILTRRRKQQRSNSGTEIQNLFQPSPTNINQII